MKPGRSEVFDEAWSTSIQSFIQRSPPGHLPDVLSACRLLVSPAKLPKDLVWRACASHNEKNLLLVRQPAAEGSASAAGAEAATSGEKELLVVHDGGRAGSRAQQQVPYKDGITDHLFAIDHEKQECTRYWLPPKSDDLMAQMENIDEELAKPFKEALHLELKRYLDESYVAEGGTTTGAAAFTLYSKKGKEVGGDIELGIIISARRARPRGLWSGSWSSQWRTLFVPGQAEAAKLLGIIEFTSHYAEEGNVHFRRRVECHASVPETKEPTKFAELVVKQIERDEAKFHLATQDSCDTLCDGAVKALRRALPVSKERFDWRPLRQIGRAHV